MISEMKQYFHQMITDAIRKGQLRLEGGDIKDLASDTASNLCRNITDPNLTAEERKNAANALVAISSVEEDLGGY